MTYGWMPKKDYETMDMILSIVMNEFPEGVLNTLEVGVRDGRTSRGIHQVLSEAGRINFHTGIDNNHDIETPVPFEGCNLIIGNSMEVYNQVENQSQAFCLLDGCHSYAMTMIDFLLYSSKVRPRGFLAFHDTSPFIKPFTDYQGSGSKDDPDNFISCRKAAQTIGLLSNHFYGWKLLIDIADPKEPTGGLSLFQRYA